MLSPELAGRLRCASAAPVLAHALDCLSRPFPRRFFPLSFRGCSGRTLSTGSATPTFPSSSTTSSTSFTSSATRSTTSPARPARRTTCTTRSRCADARWRFYRPPRAPAKRHHTRKSLTRSPTFSHIVHWSPSSSFLLCGADDQDVDAGRAEHAGPGQARARAVPGDEVSPGARRAAMLFPPPLSA